MSHGNRIEKQRSGVCSSSVWPKMPRGINGGHVFHDRNRCQDKIWVLSRLGAVSVLSDGSHGIRDKSVGDLEIAFTRGRRVVHRTQILVGESTRCSLVFWETTELLVKFDIAKRAAGRVAVGGPKFSSLN